MVAPHRPKIRIADAARAMKALLANPEDTSQVFRIIEALSGENGLRTLERLRREPSGRALLRERPDLLSRLLDQSTLKQLPDGTLGREYVRFLESEGITTEGLKQASIDGSTRTEELPVDLEYLRNRMRDAHDLWHVLTGYKGDLLGEASLLAFSFAQTRNPGVGFIVAIALIRGKEPSVRKLIAHGFVRGMRAKWLPAVEWERLLATPVDEVRAALRVGPPPKYEVFRTPEYLKVAA